MKRLNHILEHLKPLDSDCDELCSLKRRLELQSLRSHFYLSDERLKEMALYMIHEMHVGLKDEMSSTLRMLPSFVYRKDVSNTTGVYYALDLGGTNFRVLQIELHEGKLISHSSKKFKIPLSAMNGDANELFSFIADSIAEFERVKGITREKRAPLGFTFSFPTKQTDINAGSLIAWTKGFTTKGVVGEDLVKLLQSAIDARGIKLDVVALCNDTVGTLVTRYFSDPLTEVGVILGTGSNACYWEKAENVTKNNKVLAHKGEDVCINMEFGNFDSSQMFVLPRTPFDDDIDHNSPNPGFQRLEKMISGYYKGELVRLVITRLSRNGILPKVISERLTKRYEFESKDVSSILGDRLPGHHLTGRVLKDNYGIDLPNLTDRLIVKEACELVANRAAQLSGMAIGATLLKAGKQFNATVAIDGAVFQFTPTFKAILERTIHTIVRS